MVGTGAGAQSNARLYPGSFHPAAITDPGFSEPYPAGNIDSRPLVSVFTFCALFYLTIYAFEAPARFVLYLFGKDNLILLRDGLIVGPLALLFADQALRSRLHPAFVIFAVLIAFHGLVLMGTIGSALGVAYGAKILINLLFGFFLASLLLQPSNKTIVLLLFILLLTLVGVGLDKFAVTFPWTGLKTVVGDINVDVSKDWDIQDPLARRVAGFTRSSISVAVLLPLLTIILIPRIRSWLARATISIASLGAVALTTQKGSLLAFAPTAAILFLPLTGRMRMLKGCCIAFAIAGAAVPFLTMNLHLEHGTGVFSTESLYLRVAATWPQAWAWIQHHQMMVFGVGLGGIGGPQRFYAFNSFNSADNLFILLYAYFGVFGLFYLALVCWLILRPVTGSAERAATALAVLSFCLGYGIVLSVIEDQSAALFLGAALGVLCRETAARQTPAQSRRANAQTIMG